MQAKAAVENATWTEVDVATYFDELRSIAARTASPAHRRALRNYVLQSLFIVTGTPDRIATDRLLAEDVEFKFMDTERAYSGMRAVVNFLEKQVADGTNVNLPSIRRVATADWGFSSEQIDNSYLSTLAAGRLGLTVSQPGMWYLRTRPTAVSRTFDSQGLMTAQRDYPSERQNLVPVERPQFDGRLSGILGDTIEKARREFAENPDGHL